MIRPDRECSELQYSKCGHNIVVHTVAHVAHVYSRKRFVGRSWLVRLRLRFKYCIPGVYTHLDLLSYLYNFKFFLIFLVLLCTSTTCRRTARRSLHAVFHHFCCVALYTLCSTTFVFKTIPRPGDARRWVNLLLNYHL